MLVTHNSGDTIDELIYKNNMQGRIGTEFAISECSQRSSYTSEDIISSPSISVVEEDENDRNSILENRDRLNVRLLKMVATIHIYALAS